MTLKEIQEFFKKNISYKDWEFHVKEKEPSGLHECCTEARGTIYLQVQFLAICNVETGGWNDGGVSTEIKRQYCRKWQLSEFMTPTELVMTAKKAVLAAEEHEALENFLYKGKAIFNPHRDIEALLEVSDRSDCRG